MSDSEDHYEKTPSSPFLNNEVTGGDMGKPRHYESFRNDIHRDSGGNDEGDPGHDVSIQRSKVSGQVTSRTRWRALAACVFVPVMYFAGIIPSDTMGPQYLVHRLAEDRGINVTSPRINICGNSSDPAVSQASQLEGEASDLTVLYGYANMVPALLYCLVMGGFSDMYGRRPLLVLATFGMTAKLTVNFLIVMFRLPLWWNYVACIIDGCSGGFYAMLLSVFSTIADVNVKTADRVFWISVVSTVMSIDGSAFGILTGYFTDSAGFVLPSLLCAAFTGTSFLVSLVFFPETAPRPEKTNFSLLYNVRRISGFFLTRGTAGHKLVFLLSMAIFFFSVLNQMAVGKLDAMYQMAKPFCWSSLDIGAYNAGKQAGQYLLGTVMLKLMQRCLRSEVVLLLAAVFQAAQYILEAFVLHNWQFIIVPIVGILGTVAAPIARGIVSSQVGPEEQGAAFSTVAITEVLLVTVANTALLKIYAATVATFPGAVYLAMAGFSSVACGLVLLYLCVGEKHSHKYKKLADSEDA